jgi:hypothetical protein
LGGYDGQQADNQHGGRYMTVKELIELNQMITDVKHID